MTWKLYFPGPILTNFGISFLQCCKTKSLLFTSHILRNITKSYLAIRLYQLPYLLIFNLFHLTLFYKELFRHFIKYLYESIQSPLLLFSNKGDIYSYKMKHTTHSPLIPMLLSHGFKNSLNLRRNLVDTSQDDKVEKNTAFIDRRLGFQSQLCYMSAVWPQAYKSYDLPEFFLIH